MSKNSARYVDGFLIAIPKKNLAAYKQMAKQGAEAWMRHGALDYKECVGDDMTPQHVMFTFPKAAKLKPDEVAVFSYITFKSRAHRDKVNAKVMKEFSAYDQKDMKMPFDMKRMAYGGFTVLVSG